MKAYQLKFSQKLPITLAQAWDFFSSPANLSKITPKEMAFKTTSGENHLDKMYPGMIITYKVSPLAGVSINWMTEITQVEPEKYFIDEQRFGPFKFWHHQHHFEAIANGIEMTDIITYGIPLGFIGRLANWLFVAKQLNETFVYRENITNEIFGVYKGDISS